MLLDRHAKDISNPICHWNYLHNTFFELMMVDCKTVLLEYLESLQGLDYFFETCLICTYHKRMLVFVKFAQ